MKKQIKKEESEEEVTTSSITEEETESVSEEQSNEESVKEEASEATSSVEDEKAEVVEVSSQSESEKEEASVEEKKSESSSDESSEEEKEDKDGSESSLEKESEESEDEKEDNKDKRTVFIKGFENSLTEAMIKTEFEKIGKVENIRLPKDTNTLKNKGFAYIEFKKEADAKKALKLNGKKFLGSEVVVDVPRAPKTSNGPRGSGFTAFVKNLPYESSEESLRSYFNNLGKVLSVRIPVDKEHDNRNKGFAFVEFADKKDFEKALKKNHVFEDRKLFVVESNSRPERPNNGGDSFNRRGGFEKRNENKRNFNDGKNFKRGGDRDNKRGDTNNKKIKFDDDSD